jgi:hypothetical protein
MPEDSVFRRSWLAGHRHASFGVRRIGRGEQAAGDSVGKFTFAPEGEATHVVGVSGLRAALSATRDLIIAVVPTDDATTYDRGAFEPAVIRTPSPDALAPLPPLQPDPRSPNPQGGHSSAAFLAAVKTLESRGFTYRGGEVWVPPLGKWSPELRFAALAARDVLAVIARLGRLPLGGEAIGNWAHVQQLAGDLTRALNADLPPAVIRTPSPEGMAKIQDALSKPSEGMKWMPGDPPPTADGARKQSDAVATLEQLGFIYDIDMSLNPPGAAKRWRPTPAALSATPAAFQMYGMPLWKVANGGE